MRTKPTARIAAVLVGLEALGVLALVVWQIAALAGGDTDSSTSAIALIVLVWNRFEVFLTPRDPALFRALDVKLGSYGPEHLFGAVVGFYFGSRS